MCGPQAASSRPRTYLFLGVTIPDITDPAIRRVLAYLCILATRPFGTKH